MKSNEYFRYYRSYNIKFIKKILNNFTLLRDKNVISYLLKKKIKIDTVSISGSNTIKSIDLNFSNRISGIKNNFYNIIRKTPLIENEKIIKLIHVILTLYYTNEYATNNSLINYNLIYSILNSFILILVNKHMKQVKQKYRIQAIANKNCHNYQF